MTTIKDIRNGKYCEDCDYDCIDFANDADCCIHDTSVADLYYKTIKDVNMDKEVSYRPNKKLKTVMILKPEF